MESIGNICKIDNDKAYIIAVVNPYVIERQKIKQCTVRFDDGRHISADQRKKIYATISDICNYTGNEPQQEKSCRSTSTSNVPELIISAYQIAQ